MSLLNQYSKDPKLKILYNKKINRTLVHNNTVGPTTSLTLRTLDITPSDSNSFFVSKSGLDSNAGTQAAPFLTIKKAISSCFSGRGNIVILDSGKYLIPAQILPSTVAGIYAALGETPSIDFYMNANASFSQKTTTSIQTDMVDLSASSTWAGKGFGAVNDDGVCAVFTGKNDLLFVNASGQISKTINLTIDSSNQLDTGCNVCLKWTEDNTLFFAYIIQTTISTNNLTYTLRAEKYDSEGNLLFRKDVYTDSNGRRNCINAITDNPGNIYMSIGGNNAGFYIYKLSGDLQTISNSGALGASGFICWDGEYIAQLRPTVFYRYDKGLNFIDYINIQSSHSLPSLNGFINGNGNIVSVGVADIDGTKTVVCAEISITEKKELSYYSIKTLSDYGNDPNYSGMHVYDCTYRKDNAIAIRYSYNNNGLLVIDRDGNLLYDFDFTSETSIFRVFAPKIDDGIHHLKYTYSASSTLCYLYKFILSYKFSCLKATSGLVVNGVKLMPENACNCNKIIESTSDLTLKWCELKDSRATNYISTSDYDSDYAVEISSASKNLIISNTIIKHCAGGVYQYLGNTNIQFSQLFRMTKGYAIKINNFTSSCVLAIKHCDICYNYAGIRIVSNTYAGEDKFILKNCIIHRNTGYAFFADNLAPLLCCIYTGTINNASLGTACIKTNPLYIDEGAVNINSTDFNLQRKFLGYYFDSVALGLGDDGLNAGSLNTSLTSDPDTWSTAWLTKQYIDITVVPVSGYINIRQNGSASARKDASYEKLIIRTDGILNSELEDLLKIYLQKDNLAVRVFFEPVSDPYKYVEYTIDPTNEMKLSPGMYKLSRTGGEGASLTLVRAIEAQ